jgi:hypothetical protein
VSRPMSTCPHICNKFKTATIYKIIKNIAKIYVIIPEAIFRLILNYIFKNSFK